MDGNIFKMITIADIASMGNALSGLGSIFAIFIGNDVVAAQLLLLAVIFDSIDGPLARRFNRTQLDSVFGENIDSLADVISFGVAPAVILYATAPTYWIIIPCAIVLLCGLLRLTRYNTMLIDQRGPTRTFVGLPIPVTSFTLAALLLSSVYDVYVLSILMIIISILMISQLPYPKVSDKRVIGIVAVFMIICLIPGINRYFAYIPSYLLLLASLLYIFGTIIYGLFSETQIRNIQDRLSVFRDVGNRTSKSSGNLFKRK
ncbi:MAG: archaetidylserine synthase [Methanosphaera sp.]|jgi:archaetidylserine synthase|uniref:archaetidylserine synthase n=2 Tax=Methanosphaera TaxID=2316 RepID=UPI0023809FC1|nr:archaetidylserine synthase [Candidatus Methanosphaera massiliense]MDD6286048.1 archaetidylserine synthase [Methanobacteriaceae archaeon]MDE4077787.1 archaetidylserine synthase [Candidatus Methanosphaera massiliense]MDY2744797.1 archaetidylserine synthase [Methanosphaera sp.]